MTSESTSQVLVRYLSQQVGEPLDEQSALIECGMLDSLLLTDLVLFVQVRFGLVLEADDVTPDNFRNVAALSDLIRRKQGERSTRAA